MAFLFKNVTIVNKLFIFLILNVQFNFLISSNNENNNNNNNDQNGDPKVLLRKIRNTQFYPFFNNIPPQQQQQQSNYDFRPAIPMQQQQIQPLAPQQNFFYQQPQQPLQPPPPPPPLTNRFNSPQRQVAFKYQQHTTNEICGIVPPTLTNYIANSKSTASRKWPWHCQIIIFGNTDSDSETYCGGTLIDKRYVLTAAHCYDELLNNKRAKNTVLLFKGVDIGHQAKVNGKRHESIIKIKAKNVHIHPKYVGAISEYEAKIKNVTPGPCYDFALVELQPLPSDLEDLLVPICLPKDDYQVKTGTTCKIMGNGFMNAADEENFIMPSVLQMADVKISNNQACRDEVESSSIKSKINSDVICIRGPVHPCVGDSGGPLICQGDSNKNIIGHDSDEDQGYYSDESETDMDVKRWYLLGVTSFAVSTDNNDRCGHFKSAVFGRVSNIMKWIRGIIYSHNNFY